jgi:hypothetical protein
MAFVIHDSKDNVKIWSYNGQGKMKGSDEMPKEQARKMWKSLRDTGWSTQENSV